MSHKDIRTEGFPSLDWEPGKLREGVNALAKYADDFGRNAMNWYFEGRGTRRICCRFFRGLSVALTVCAGLVPVVDSLLPKEKYHLNPMWATLLLGSAGACIALDRFLGGTTGWVRYVQTGQSLSGALAEFEFDLTETKLGWINGEPSPEQTITAIKLIRGFVSRVHGMVADETKVWSAEFSDVLRQYDEKARELEEISQPGAIQLTVTNGEQSQPDWEVSVDGGAPLKRTGRKAVLQPAAGLRTIRVQGNIGGEGASVEVVVKVEAGSVVEKEVTLV